MSEQSLQQSPILILLLFNKHLRVFVKFGKQPALHDSAVWANMTSLVGKPFYILHRHFTFNRYPAHKRHLFKLQLRQRGRKRRAGLIIHTQEQRQRVEHTQRVRGRGSFSVFFHLHEHNREPPRQGLKMWTEVGKLVLLHLLLTELHCAKGKTLVSPSHHRRKRFRDRCLLRIALSPRPRKGCASRNCTHAMACTWIARFPPA